MIKWKLFLTTKHYDKDFQQEKNVKFLEHGIKVK